MKASCLLLSISVVVLPTQTDAQQQAAAAIVVDADETSVVWGRFRFKPALSPPDAEIRIVFYEDDAVLQELTAEREPHYRFRTTLPEGLGQNTVTVRVLVASPEGWVDPSSAHAKHPCCPLELVQTLKRKEDAFVEARNRALEAMAERPEDALRWLESAKAWTASPAQTIEVYRLAAKVYANQDDWEGHQRELTDAFGAIEDFGDLGPNKTRVYFEERLDGLLEWSGYGGMRVPARDIGPRVASNSTLLGAWRALVRDARTSGEPSASSSTESLGPAAEISCELQRMNDWLGRPSDLGYCQS